MLLFFLFYGQLFAEDHTNFYAIHATGTLSWIQLWDLHSRIPMPSKMVFIYYGRMIDCRWVGRL